MSRKTEVELIEKLIGIFDDILSESGWESSFLLKVARKRLVKARKSLEDVKQERLVEGGAVEENISDDSMIVYVSLYQVGGHNLILWEQMLKVLSSCSLGRPIYASEAEVIAAVGARPDLKKEAYAEVVIPKNSVLTLSSDKAAIDANGAKLLTLRHEAISVLGMRRFVHANNLVYKFIDGKLTLLGHSGGD